MYIYEAMIWYVQEHHGTTDIRKTFDRLDEAIALAETTEAEARKSCEDLTRGGVSIFEHPLGEDGTRFENPEASEETSFIVHQRCYSIPPHDPKWDQHVLMSPRGG
jgi:hypothetical protein